WEWVKMPGDPSFAMYACRPPGSEGAIVVGASAAAASGGLEIDSFLNGVTKGVARQGLEGSIERAPSDLPVGPGSFRYVVTLKRAGRPVARIFGYVGARGRLFNVNCTDPGTEEPPDLRRVAESFKVLRDRASARRAEKLGELVGRVLGLVAIIAAVAWISRRRARAAPRP
ncbi:MAG TPA: hypothetical protein VHF22_15715, partial [Planctomycetota bacterium]|nr:hypothetical protein [Planctomycetota bacterium]